MGALDRIIKLDYLAQSDTHCSKTHGVRVTEVYMNNDGPSLFKSKKERERDRFGHSNRKSLVPVLQYSPSSCFSSDPQRYRPPQKHCGNPRSLPYHILIFPQTWSLSEYLLWLAIVALIKGKHFRILCLIYCFFLMEWFSPSHLNLKVKLIWQSAAISPTDFLYAAHANV